MKKIKTLSDIDLNTPEGVVLYNTVHLVMKLKQDVYANVDQLLKEASKTIKEDIVKVVTPCKPCNKKKAK